MAGLNCIMVFTILAIAVTATYCILVLILTYGLFTLRGDRGIHAEHFNTITIIIAVRDEQFHLPALIDQLKTLDYPSGKFEVVFVNDHSTDRSAEILHSACDGQHFRCVSLTNTTGKKEAIELAVSQSNADIIVTTDADCHVNTNWLRYINAIYDDSKIKMVVGGVRIEANGTLFQQLQALEFVSVAATGASTISLGAPTMCNGANLSYRRSAFVETGGYSGAIKISSGDDEFLMNEFNRRWESSIAFMNSPASIVSTPASSTLSKFFQQRLRWAGKWKTNRSFATKAIAFFAWLLQLSLLAIPFGWIAGCIDTRVFLILLASKLVVDFIFLFKSSRFFRVSWSWISFLVLQLVYSPYVVYVGILSQILTPVWKGRAVGTKV